MAKLSFPKGMPQHQIDAIKNGGSAYFEGVTYTLASLGFDSSLATATAVDAAIESASKDEQIADLTAKLEAAQKAGGGGSGGGGGAKKADLDAANAQIADLTAKLEAAQKEIDDLKAAAPAKPEDTTVDPPKTEGAK